MSIRRASVRLMHPSRDSELTIFTGLLAFGTTPDISLPLTHIIENFRSAVNTMTPNGDTALWDALALATDQFTEDSQMFPNAKKRIICLSDGVDTKSSKSDHEIARRLIVRIYQFWELVFIGGLLTSRKENQVVVDSFCIGDEDNEDLRTISYMYVKLHGLHLYPT